jgi:hypothetical protein
VYANLNSVANTEFGSVGLRVCVVDEFVLFQDERNARLNHCIGKPQLRNKASNGFVREMPSWGRFPAYLVPIIGGQTSKLPAFPWSCLAG